MLLTYAVIALALFFAMNIGASGTAATMASAYGGGAIRSRTAAVILAGLAAMLGAFTGGQEVALTLGKGIIDEDILILEVAAIIIASACLTLFLANLAGIPLSTSEVTVGSILGAGLAYQNLYLPKVLVIVSVWVFLPIIAFVFAYYLAKFVPRLENSRVLHKNTHLVKYMLIAAGCWEAYAAGMNNVANAIAPLVGAGVMSMSTGILWGAVFVALGAMFLGGRVLETNAKKITKLTMLQGTLVSGVSGTLVVIASLFGIPVPLTQATTVSILGIGVREHGARVWKKQVVKKIIQVWLVSPFASMLTTFLLLQVFLFKNFYSVVILISVLITTLGCISLMKLNQSSNEGHLSGNHFFRP
jgi:sulfate permease